jgi:hypothetical protein
MYHKRCPADWQCDVHRRSGSRVNEETRRAERRKEIFSEPKYKGGVMGEVTNEQVNLMLRLYEERREPKLREARE